MAHGIAAPWGTPQPDAGPFTAEALLALGDAGRWHEVVEGVLIEMAPTGFEHGQIVQELARVLANHVRAQHLGVVTAAETGYVLSAAGEPDTVLAPDVAFVQAARVPPRGAPGNERFLRLAPDLVAEIASPDQFRPEMAAKAALYLTAGVRLVWIVWPAARAVDVWRPGHEQPVARLGEADALDGVDVVTGFAHHIVDLFQ
jgi:Uma2 family endonuclease